MKSGAFIQAKHHVHILNSLSGSTFKQVIYYSRNHQPVFNFIHMNKTFIGIYNLFQVRYIICQSDKRMLLVIF